MDGKGLNNLLFVSIISADNEEYTEEQKQDVISRYDLEKNKKNKDWKFILEPVDKDGKLAKLFE